MPVPWMRGLATARDLFKQTFIEWREDDALQWGAALAFYAVLSLAPMMLIAIAVAGLVFGEAGVETRILDQVRALVGDEGARLVEEMVRNAGRRGGGVWATVVGVATVLVGATTAFAQLKVAMNRMWDVRQRPKGVKGFLRRRVLALGLVLTVGFLLLVSLVATAALSLFDEWVIGLFPKAFLVLRLATLAVSFAVVTLLFALIFRFLPDVQVAWKDTWWGAGATALLFTLGQYAIGLYLGNSSVASSYGAAGALVVILLWVYYSSQILLFGAEFTQVHARHRGARMEPDPDTVPA